jgi:hypothetical protein
MRVYIYANIEASNTAYIIGLIDSSTPIVLSIEACNLPILLAITRPHFLPISLAK